MVLKEKIYIVKIIYLIVFLLIILVLFIGNFFSLWKLFKTEVKAIFFSEHRDEFMIPGEIETSYNSNFYKKLSFVDINGVVHKIMGQKLMNGAIKGKNDKLFLETDKDYRFSSTLEEKNINDALKILHTAEENGAQAIYVQRPMKYLENKDELPYGMKVEYNQQYDFWCEKISYSGIGTLDLRKSLKNKLEFYKTDHHWTVESSFYAAQDIIEYLNLDNVSLIDYNRYSLEKYENSFLGSEGVKTGKYYIGKDDFNILIPKFDTNFIYKHYVDGQLQTDKIGSFKEAFIDKSILEDGGYYNKYNACLYGGDNENIIINNDFEKGKKLLLISDSYARPMSMYLASVFSEIRYLDPQEGRYNNSYIEYIEKYKPDIVILMYTGEFVKI